MRYQNLRGAQIPHVNDVETVNVMKQIEKRNNSIRYRFRINGEDVPHDELRRMPGFKVSYSYNMTEEDIAKVEAKWGHNIIKEILQ